MLWSIWKSRNNVVFRNGIFHPLACLISAKKAFAEWRLRSCISIDDCFKGPSSTPSPTSIHFVRWYAPPLGVVKINFDGSSINIAVAGGFILRDQTGKVIKLSAANYGLTSSLVAEARVLKDGVALAVQARYSMTSIEGDNTAVIHALKGESKGPWQISHIIEDVRACLHQDIQVFINHTFWEANMAWQHIDYLSLVTQLQRHSPRIFGFHQYSTKSLLMIVLVVLL